MKVKRRGLKRHRLVGWVFIGPAIILILFLSFIPMFQALLLSLQTGTGNALSWGGLANYRRIFDDRVFHQAISNTFFYLIVQVPIMLIMALILASMLNNKKLRFKGIFRTCIFIPAATSLVSYAIIFRTLFANHGFVNYLLVNMGIFDAPFNFFTDPTAARIIIIVALIWRWTGFNMIFYLAGLQNIEYSIYEAAMIDGANARQRFMRITVPLLKPIILVTTIMSTNGTLQLFDESVNLTGGGPANQTITMAHYIFNTSFEGMPRFGYATAMSFLILMMVGILSFIQMKVGGKRD